MTVAKLYAPGDRIGSRVIVERAENSTGGSTRWRMLCDCGSTSEVRGCDLRATTVRTCRKCAARARREAKAQASTGGQRSVTTDQ